MFSGLRALRVFGRGHVVKSQRVVERLITAFIQKRFLLVAMALISACAVVMAADSPSVKQIDAAIALEMKKQKVPGLALGVVHKDKLLVAKGYGLANVELDVPVTVETIFQSGSVGKQFTAAAVMLLVEDGKLSLDDPITKFYPEAPYHWRRITVRHLLTGTSGLPFDFDEATFDLRKDYSEDEYVRLAFGLKLLFEPGARWSYSNTAFVVLGCLVRKVSGQFYGDLLRDRVFKPTGMKTTRIISDADIVPNRAAGYRIEKGELKNQEWVSPSNNTTGDGALYLSIRDFLAWDKAIRTRSVLKPDSWAKIFTPVRLNSGRTYPYGFGWNVDEDLGQVRIHHGGAWQGFKAYICRFLGDDLSVLVLINLANAQPEAFVDSVAGLFNPRLVVSTEPAQDLDPTLANILRKFLAKTRDGKLAPEDFSFMPTGYFPKTPEEYQKLLAPLGDPERLLLIKRVERGDDLGYRCRAIFKDKQIEIALRLSPENKPTLFYLWEDKKSP